MRAGEGLLMAKRGVIVLSLLISLFGLSACRYIRTAGPPCVGVGCPAFSSSQNSQTKQAGNKQSPDKAPEAKKNVANPAKAQAGQ
jgi:hypothetical protein